jgi:hypothetical protein
MMSIHVYTRVNARGNETPRRHARAHDRARAGAGDDRHPRLEPQSIYVGMLLVYAGIGIAVRSPWILVLALPLAMAIRYGVVAREEAYLERCFGNAYRDYKARVRRWL